MPVRPHCLALVLLAALPSPVLARDEPSPALKARIAKLGGSEHVRIAMRYENDRLTMMHDDDVCAYHHARPFPELTALGNAR